MKLDTQIVQSGRPNTGPVNTPVYRASTIVFQDLDEFDQGKEHGRHVLTYGRYGTPTTFNLENAIAELEGAYAAALAPSGLAALTTALQAFLCPGDHLLMPESVYGPARRFALEFLMPRGIECDFYPHNNIIALKQRLRPNTKVVYLESPGSLTFEMEDISAITAICRPLGITTIADNTWATPIGYQPLAYGVDVSLQAGTKYLVGHSDAMIGTIATTEAAWPDIARAVASLGVCVSPDDAFLAARGLRTLSVRLRHHARSALQLADWLVQRPEVAHVLYPPHPSDPGHAIWSRDFKGASGLMGVRLKREYDREAVSCFVDQLKIFRLGGSWGGFESLAFPVRPEFTHEGEVQPESIYFRLHVGLEDVQDMITDLSDGFARLQAFDQAIRREA